MVNRHPTDFEGTGPFMTDWQRSQRFDDPEALFALARDKSKKGREDLMQAMTGMFAEEGEALGETERRMMSDILRRLIGDVEAAIRRSLAEKLADMPGAPPDLVRELANDEASVAHPILLRSPLLRDVDLIEIIRHRTLEHQLAIAMRATVSPSVSDALVDTGSDEVLARLLDNPGAGFAPETFERIVDRAEGEEGLHAPLLKREELTPALARKMHWWVSAALREAIMARYGALDELDLDDGLEASVAELLGDASLGDADPIDTIVASKNMKDPEIGEDEMVKALARGDVQTFEKVLLERTGLRPKLLRRLLFEPGGEGLAIACRAVGISPKLFAAIYRLTREAHPKLRLAKGELTKATKLYLNMDEDAARTVVRRWRRNPDFQWAIRQVGEGAG